MEEEALQDMVEEVRIEIRQEVDVTEETVLEDMVDVLEETTIVLEDMVAVLEDMVTVLEETTIVLEDMVAVLEAVVTEETVLEAVVTEETVLEDMVAVLEDRQEIEKVQKIDQDILQEKIEIVQKKLEVEIRIIKRVNTKNAVERQHIKIIL